MSCLCRGVCIGVSLARLASGWGDEYSVHKAPTPSLQVQQGTRVSVPLLHLTCMSSSPKRQNCTSLFSLQRNNLSLPLLSCYSPSSLSSFSFTLSTRQIPGTCRLPVARNLPFATYRLSATLITPTNFKKQKEILKSSQVTKQATQFTFAEPPSKTKTAEVVVCLVDSTSALSKKGTEQPASHTAPWNPASLGNAAQACTGMQGEQHANKPSFAGSHNALA